MSRSGYSEDFDDPLQLGRWRQAVRRSLEGKRGQAFLRETLAALDAMPVKELAPDSLVTETGGYCTLGVVGAARGLPMENLDPEDPYGVARTFGIAQAMVREIVYMNDEYERYRYEEIAGPPNKFYGGPRPYITIEETPAERWARMRAWIVEKLLPGEGEAA